MDIFTQNTIDVEPVSERDFIEAAKLLTMTAVCLEARGPVVRAAAAVRVIVRRIVRRLHSARSDLGDGAASILALRVPSKRLDPSGSRRFSFVGAA
jgi:hypothetical protein